MPDETGKRKFLRSFILQEDSPAYKKKKQKETEQTHPFPRKITPPEMCRCFIQEIADTFHTRILLNPLKIADGRCQIYNVGCLI